jgi:ribose/xylose/arabinose/galactoside ABC-type transport system permease subunit
MSGATQALGRLRRIPRGAALAAVMYLLMLILPSVFSGTIQDQNYLDIFQEFANVAPLALAVGLTMIMAEFDISVVSTYTLGGVLAIKLGDSSGILLGVLVAAGAGILLGVIQGAIIARLKISSVPVTLAGFLVIWGLANIIAGGEQAASTNYAPGEELLGVVLTIFTFGSLLVIGGTVLVHVLLAYTRLGRDLRAVGGDRRASAISGIRVPLVIVGTFAAAGLIAALGGAVQALSYSTANPNVSFNPLVVAVIAAIIGGVGISGAKGSALGIACGVLTLALLHETLIIIEIDPDLATVITGGILMIIAVLSAPELRIPRSITARIRTQT